MNVKTVLTAVLMLGFTSAVSGHHVPNEPPLVRTAQLATHFQSNGYSWRTFNDVDLGFGVGKKQYVVLPWSDPRDNETVGVFFEWHTENYFGTANTNPHLAVGLRGPKSGSDSLAHRGRGIAIGKFRERDPNTNALQWEGCPSNGTAFFIEDFSADNYIPNATTLDLQRSKCTNIALSDDRTYRIDIHIAKNSAWIGVWEKTSVYVGLPGIPYWDNYHFLGQAYCGQGGYKPCPEWVNDRRTGNLFIGNAFGSSTNRSTVTDVHIATF